MAPKRKQAGGSLGSKAQSFCAVCNRVHSATMTSRHEEGIARPGVLASAMLDDRFVEMPKPKRRRHAKEKAPVHVEGSTLPVLPDVHVLDEPMALETAGDVNAAGLDSELSGKQPDGVDLEQELEALSEAMQAGPWQAGLELDDNESEIEEEGGEGGEDDIDEPYDPAKDDEEGQEAWVVMMEEAAKRDTRDFGKQ
jgi:hypothetical protein